MTQRPSGCLKMEQRKSTEETTMLTAPPRYSVNDPDFTPTIGQRLTIYLNEQEVLSVVAYDAEEGWVEYHPKDILGNFIITNEDNVLIHKVKGNVRVVMR